MNLKLSWVGLVLRKSFNHEIFVNICKQYCKFSNFQLIKTFAFLEIFKTIYISRKTASLKSRFMAMNLWHNTKPVKIFTEEGGRRDSLERWSY